jgi:lysozyme
MSNPSFTRDQAIDKINYNQSSDRVHLIGYRSSTSKYGEYDDTIAILSSDSYTEVRANTLPSVWKPGIAKLLPGNYKYNAGLHGMHHLTSSGADQAILAWLNSHKGQEYPASLIPDGKLVPYWAFRQAGPVTLLRDGQLKPETQLNPAFFPFIDIHHGGWNLTSSEGCQTIFPQYWSSFRSEAYAAMEKENQQFVTYHLIEL